MRGPCVKKYLAGDMFGFNYDRTLRLERLIIIQIMDPVKQLKFRCPKFLMLRTQVYLFALIIKPEVMSCERKNIYQHFIAYFLGPAPFINLSNVDNFFL